MVESFSSEVVKNCSSEELFKYFFTCRAKLGTLTGKIEQSSIIEL